MIVRCSNDNSRFTFVVTDVFSRELWAQQDKTPGETLASFKNIEAGAEGFPN